MISFQLCPVCAAANETTATRCCACEQRLFPEARQADPLLHTLLFDRYHILTTLGSGGFSSVYLARDNQTNQLVAMKQITLRGLSAEEIIDATNTFHRELEVLAKLHHAQVPSLYNYFQDRDHWYLVLEYFDGPTLETYLERSLDQGKPLPFQEVVTIGLQLCAVLDYLHTRQPPIIYRDLKPGNIIRSPEGKLSLIDFGIARHFRPRQSRDTQLLGSPGYAAPEQYGRAQTTPRSDIYSLGVLLYAALTRSDPTRGFPDPATLELAEHPGGQQMRDLLARMLAVDPENRPASTREVAIILEAIEQYGLVAQESRRIWIPPTPQPMPPSSPSREHISLSPTTRTLLPTPQIRINRRAVLIGLGAFAVASTGAGIGWKWKVLMSHGETLPVSPTRLPSVSSFISDPAVANGVAWSNDGQLIAFSSHNVLQVWSIEPQRDIFIFTGKDGDDFNGLAWSPDGLWLALASIKEGIILVEAKNGESWTHYQKNNLPVYAVGWSPDSRKIVCGNADGTVDTWDIASGNILFTYQGQGSSVRAVAWSPNSQFIASATSEGAVNTWNIGIDEPNFGPGFGDDAAISVVNWSPDSNYLAIASHDRTVTLVRVRKWSGEIPLVYTGHTASVTGVAWSPSGKHIASIDITGNIQIWEAFTGKRLITYTDSSGSGGVVAWSPDGQNLATGSLNDSVKIWRVGN